jgi:hypothetical protein
LNASDARRQLLLLLLHLQMPQGRGSEGQAMAAYEQPVSQSCCNTKRPPPSFAPISPPMP